MLRLKVQEVQRLQKTHQLRLNAPGEIQGDSVHKLQVELRVEQAKPVLKEQEGCGEQDSEGKMNNLLMHHIFIIIVISNIFIA